MLLSDLETLLRRLDRRTCWLGWGARYVECGFGHPLCLVSSGGVIRCRACDRRRRGQSPVDAHHLGCGAEKPILVSANLHPILSFLQDLWREVFGWEAGSPEAILLDLLFMRLFEPL